MLDLFLVLWLWRAPLVMHLVYGTQPPAKQKAPASKDVPQCENNFSFPWSDGRTLTLCASDAGMWIVEKELSHAEQMGDRNP